MKFRQFNFNPFQRNKNKKKNREIIEEKHQCKDDILDQNSNKCNIYDLKEADDISHVGYPETCILDLAGNDEPHVHEYKQLNVEVGPQNLLHYYPYLGLIDSVNFNEDREFTKCSCKFLTDYCESPNLYDKHCNLFNPNELSNVGEKKNNIRTARSRIKTNPWLPTPRPIFDISPTNSIRTNARSPRCLREKPEVTTNLVNSVSLNVCFADKGNNQSSSDYNSLLNTDSLDRDVARQQLSLNNLNCRWSIISDGDISIDLNSSPVIEDIGNNFFNLESNINFEYENNVDLVLDDEFAKRGIKTSVSINDLLEDSLVSYSDLAPRNSLSEYSSDENSTCSEKMDESFSDNLFPYDDCSFSSENEADISSADVSFTEEYCDHEINTPEIVLAKCNNLDDSIDAGYSSLKRDGRMGSDAETDSSQEKVETHCENCLQNANQNEVAQCVPRRSFNDFERSLPEIKSSLEEKVSILRLEKNIVQQKIREAQEEEQIRMEEKNRFGSQLSVHKKQILLDTLTDLKDKLENQSRRLQKSYSAVLTMQKQFSSRRASFSFISTTHMCT